MVDFNVINRKDLSLNYVIKYLKRIESFFSDFSTNDMPSIFLTIHIRPFDVGSALCFFQSPSRKAVVM